MTPEEYKEAIEEPLDWDKMSPKEKLLLKNNSSLREPKKKKGLVKKKKELPEEDAPFSEEEAPFEAEEKPLVTGKGLIKSFAESAPTAGMVVGGVLGTPVAPPFGTLAGAGLGYGFGKGVENLIEQHVLDEPKTREEIYGDPIKGVGEGAAMEAGGLIFTKGLQNFKNLGQKSMQVPTSMRESVQQAERYTPATRQETMFDPRPKMNAGQIASSARSLGTEATPGMLSRNPNIHDLESTLSNSPTWAGEKVRKSYQPVYEKMQKTAEKLAPQSERTLVQSAEDARKGIVNKIEGRAAPLENDFQNIRGSTVHIQPQPSPLKRAAQGLRRSNLGEFPELPQGSAIHKYANAIENAKSIDSLKQLRTSAGAQQTAAYRSGNNMEAAAYTKVINTIKRLERREIIKAATENLPPAEAGKQAKALIEQIKTTNEGWRTLMTELQELSGASGLGNVKNPRQVIAKIENLDAEDLARKMFDTGRHESLQTIKKFAPEEFELLRQARLSQIAEKSKTNGEISPRKLITNLHKIGPEARNLLFGPKSESVFQDLSNVVYSIPANINPSKTSKGNTWMKYALNPFEWGRYGEEAGAAISYMTLNNKLGVQTARGFLGQGKNLLSTRPVRTPIGMGAYGGIKGLLTPDRQEEEEELAPWDE